MDPIQVSHSQPAASRRYVERQPGSQEIRRQYVGRLLLDRRRPHNCTEEEARPAIRHHDHRRDRSSTAGLGCQLLPHCRTIPQSELNKVHYAARIPTFEDKVAQRAIVMVLEAVYEQDFRSCSYGLRPGRSAHQPLRELYGAITRQGQYWVLDVDIRKYFDSIPHDHLRAILDQRVTDGVIRRMIDKWLKAGVLEDGLLRRVTEGTPQGGVISPLLSNIYLHHVLDEWFESEVRPRLSGTCTLVRFADDFVMTFKNHHDAKRVLEVLGKRLERYGLTLHPDKTRFIDFRPERRDGTHPDCKEPPFDFLGFTHTWVKSQKGKNVVRQTTAKGRLARALIAINDWCRTNRHRPILDQHTVLSAKLRGHYAYYAITGNMRQLQRYAQQVTRVWRKWLERRTRAKRLLWSHFGVFLAGHSPPAAET